MEIEKLLTVKNYAKLKDVTPQAIYAWIKRGFIKSVKIDGVTFIINE